MNKLLTIIVPSYNMEKLLGQNLQTLLINNNSHRVEVLVVNDGSKDRTLAIARGFEQRFPEIFTVIDKENGNYGSCINAGLKVARGKYVKIMDADDCFDTAFFESFVDCLTGIDVDVVINDYYKLYSNGKREDFTYSMPVKQSVLIADVYDENSFSTLLLPALTYRTSILKAMNYHQTEGISYTDTEWCYSPMTQMSTLFYFNSPVYIYKMGREGQTMDPVVFRQRLPQLFQCLHSLMNSLDCLSLSPWAKRFANEQLTKHSLAMYRYYLIDHPQEKRDLLVDFDVVLKRKNPEVYMACAYTEYRKKISYRFVEEWRTGRHKNIPFSVRGMELVFDFLGTIHYYILKAFNPNLKR